jgi:hypothetical protein
MQDAKVYRLDDYRAAPDTPVHLLEGRLDCRKRRRAKRTGRGVLEQRAQRRCKGLMATRLVICLLLVLVWCSSAYSGDMVWQASIIDGDTLEIHGTRIRLWGIDAPESNQLCRAACNIAAERRLPTISTPSLPDGP